MGRVIAVSLRRRLVTALVAALVVGSFGSAPSVSADPLANPIVVENRNPGSLDWQYRRDGRKVSTDAGGQILGYGSATSLNKGESIDLHVSVNPPQTYSIDVYRMGWYGGTGGRLLGRFGPLDGVTQPACPMDSLTGLVECDWSVSHTLSVPVDWTTGVYVALLTNAALYQSRIIFVVRDDSRTADLLYQQPVLTYAAYNSYPAGSPTGKSLYKFNSSGPNTVAGSPRAVKVSLDRPGGDQYGSDLTADDRWELYLLPWLERSGYDVSYTTDIDTHTNPSRLLGYKGFLSAGHNEYWTKAMYDGVERARDQGVNLAFFAANAVYWQVRLEPSSSGVPDRVVVGYKSSSLDPIADPSLETDMWRRLGRPEQTLVGVQFVGAGPPPQAPFVVQSSSSWVYSATGFVDGSQVPGMVGNEVDALESSYPGPVARSYTTLGRSPYVDTAGNGLIAESSIYQAPSGAWIFASGTHGWSFALGKPGIEDEGIKQTTRTILDRFVAPAAPSQLVARRTAIAVKLGWADNNEPDLAGYNVYRAVSESGPFRRLNNGPLTASAYSDGSAPIGSTSFYRVTSIDTGGAESEPATTSAIRRIGFVGAATAADKDASSLEIARPAGTVSGDVMLAAILVAGDSTISRPSGWVRVVSTASGLAVTQVVFRRIAGPSEPASYTWTIGPAAHTVGAIVTYRGGVAVDGWGGQGNGSSTSIVAPSVTASSGDGLLIGFFGIAGRTSITPGPGMREAAEVAIPTAGKPTLEVADEVLGPAGATGVRTAMPTVAARNVGQVVVLRP